jgi:hypothetical protein
MVFAIGSLVNGRIAPKVVGLTDGYMGSNCRGNADRPLSSQIVDEQFFDSMG